MKYELVEVNKHFELQKGISYTSKELVDESETGLLTINAFTAGGGFKLESEKPYGGELKPDYLLSDGDVLLAMTEQDAGLLASPLTIKSDYSRYSNLTFSLDVARVKCTSGEVDPNFLYNVLRIPAFRVRAAYGDTGSTVQRLPYEAFGELKIPRPPLNVQKAIVRVIDDIDSKIHLNKQSSWTFEQIAQTIFKSWFIDFDPVHAKARGEQPEGMDAGTAVLFPDSFEDSELGPIPAGWTVKPVGDVLENVGGATPSTVNADYWNGGIDWTTPKDLAHNNQLISLGSIRKISDKGLKRISSGLLAEKSVLFSSRAPIGYIAISAVPTAVNQGFIAFPNSEKSYSPMYIANWLHFNLQEIESRAGGTSFSEISKSAFRDIPFVVPTPLIADKYLSLTAEILEQLVNLAKQNKTLEALRDSLLPRLVSGELEIPEELLGE